MHIAIVGAHRKTKLCAPYDDQGCQIWACSYRNENELPRHDLWFEIHDLKTIHNCGKEYVEFLKTLPNLYMQERFQEFPNALPFPLGVIKTLFGEYFLSGSISYMMARAIMKSPRKISLWGIVGDCPEYHEQKKSIHHFTQIARDRGIEVISPAYEDLLKPPPAYGYA